MNVDDALDFLRSNQPMPGDLELTETVIDKYDEVRKYFQATPDNRAISLFLNSFGEGDGFGVYQLVEDTLREHDDEIVVAALRKSLSSEQMSVRSWSAQIAMTFPDPTLVPQLVKNLKCDDYDVKAFALNALEFNSGALPLQDIQRFIEAENDEELIGMAKDVLQAHSSP